MFEITINHPWGGDIDVAVDVYEWMINVQKQAGYLDIGYWRKGFTDRDPFAKSRIYLGSEDKAETLGEEEYTNMLSYTTVYDKTLQQIRSAVSDKKVRLSVGTSHQIVDLSKASKG